MLDYHEKRIKNAEDHLQKNTGQKLFSEIMNSDLHCGMQSQNMFPSTGQLFEDLNPISSPTNTQAKFVTPSASRMGRQSGNKINERTFLAPFRKSTKSNEMDIDNIFESQLPSTHSISASPTLALRKKPNCFQVPLMTQKNDERNSRGQRVASSSSLQFAMDNADKVESFINKVIGSSGQKLNGNKSGSESSHLLNRNVLPNDNYDEQLLPLREIPETPKIDKFASSTSPTLYENGFDGDIIADSDDENGGGIYGPCMQTPGKVTLPPIKTPGGGYENRGQLRPIEEIPSRYRIIFEKIPCFNIVQSKVFDDALYTDKSLVVCAPTGSGKTIVFELAIVRLLINNEKLLSSGKRGKAFPKIVYMAPIKALCAERHEDWTMKFHSLGLSCQELTGDSDVDEFWQLQKADVILTTPEKWDSMTRRWRDNSSLVRQVKLFLIDEVHLLNDESRGATMEAVVSRMKTIQASLSNNSSDRIGSFRFIAVSATIPNTGDIAEWLGSTEQQAVAFSMDDSCRPVVLRKVVLGYPWSSGGSEFKFDISLNYKLGNVIQTYSENKPTLIFCATRKSVEQAASTLAKDLVFVLDGSHKQTLAQSANLVRNHRLRELLLKGIGYHHAGLDAHDRHLTEELFTQGELLVLVSTSTLAMGVNLPAHLVVIKSTSHYVKGMFQEYSQSEVLQMIGRAGRPQFDTSATAVIMTRSQTKKLYLNLVNGTQKIESSLHKHLIEHLNAEIVLSTIHDVTIALEWIRSTFLYIRLLKNPTHYGYPANLSKSEAEKRLHELCMRDLDSLTATGLVSMDNELRLLSSEAGRLMARYSIAFETIKTFSALSGKENLSELIEVLSSIHEFRDVMLRMNERSALNKMNKDKNRVTIRFPMNGKVKTSAMKVNCLLQATLGCLSVQDFTLTQDVTKIFRNAMRVTRCLVEYQILKDDFKLLYNSVVLAKCVKAKLWENSRYVTKQLPNIGPTLSNALANAGVCSFAKLEATDPREIELILNRHPPFGNHLREAVKALPKYAVHVEQSKRYKADSCEVTITVLLTNTDDLKERKTAGAKHGCLLLIGDADSRALLKQRLSDAQLMSCENCKWQRTMDVARAAKGDELSINLISHDWVGLDVESTYTPYYLGPRRVIATQSGTTTVIGSKESKYFEKKKKPCRHTCTDKMLCAHDCCKILSDGSIGVGRGRLEGSERAEQSNSSKSAVESLKKFKYSAMRSNPSGSNHSNQVVPSTPSQQRTKGWEHLDSFCEYQQIQDDVDDGQMLESLSAFEREQSYYDDQINIGSRMKYSGDDSSAAKKRHFHEQLWTEDAPTQSGNVNADDELAVIKPRPSRRAIRKLASGTEPCEDTAMQASSTNRMGRVLAWKSSTASKNGLFNNDLKPTSDSALARPPATCAFPPNSQSTYVSTTPAPSLSRDIFNWSRPSDCLQSRDPASLASSFFPAELSQTSLDVTSSYGALPEKHVVCSQAVTSRRPTGPNCGPSYEAFGRGLSGVRGGLTGPTGFVERSQRMSGKYAQGRPPVEAINRNKRDFTDQLWEQAPSQPYLPFSGRSTSSIRHAGATKSHPTPHCDADTSDEKDVSICCDFSLEEEEEPDVDDMAMMAACIEAEKSEAEQIETTFPSSTTSCRDQIEVIETTSSYNGMQSVNKMSPTISPTAPRPYNPSASSLCNRNLSKFFGSDTQRATPTRKLSQVTDAKKMFDSIFDGIF